ncbi:MAG TPA: SPFH domain-containing protein [Patescibacteria group bacterium]|jgi:regulator of protease activity HflC (stomatin/prohibitin superfamily)|nr:SPFH domain-containing protein [Patescibacteria group bacterium]
MEPFTLAMLLLLLIGTVFFMLCTIRMCIVVREAEVVIIERFGKFYKILHPGIHLVIPFMERPRTILWTTVVLSNNEYRRTVSKERRIDLRECVYDFPRQNVITKDNVTMEITAILYYQIVAPRAAVYEVYNLSEAIEKLAQTTLRNIIGSMDLDETLVSRDIINEKLHHVLYDAANKWGVQVNRVELQEVNPPIDIRHAMEKQMRAERERREMILRAEGAKASSILEAEGKQESQILIAKGHAQAEILEAEGKAIARTTMTQAEAQAIELLNKKIPHDQVIHYLIAQQYINSFADVMTGKDNKTVVVPYEISSLISSVGVIATLFNTEKNR